MKIKVVIMNFNFDFLFFLNQINKDGTMYEEELKTLKNYRIRIENLRSYL